MGEDINNNAEVDWENVLRVDESVLSTSAMVNTVATKDYVREQCESLGNKFESLDDRLKKLAEQAIAYEDVFELELQHLKEDRQKEKIQNFLSTYKEGWCVRIYKSSCEYYVVITYVEKDRFKHITHPISESPASHISAFDLGVKTYKDNKYVISLSLCKTFNSKTSSIPCTCIVYDTVSHKSEIVNPVSDLLKSKDLLECIGHRLPKRYVKRLQEEKPYTMQYYHRIKSEEVPSYLDREQNVL